MRKLLVIDSAGGLIVGSVMLAFSKWLVPLYDLSNVLYWGVTCANLLYGCSSFTIVRMQQRGERLITLMAGANILWGAFCIIASFLVSESVSFFGVWHLRIEGIFVSVLGLLEWKYRHMLTSGGRAICRINVHKSR